MFFWQLFPILSLLAYVCARSLVQAFNLNFSSSIILPAACIAYIGVSCSSDQSSYTLYLCSPWPLVPLVFHPVESSIARFIPFRVPQPGGVVWPDHSTLSI
ncbi:hypothetical protein HD806DRAFT_473968 [Xylariaceae sp. AK1471]|nr:hypothetical protein HD806DRAFT_473968 [Xylariaceae sp. AK1471]